MPSILPFIPSVAFYRFGTVLDGDPYIFDVRWNSRDAAWFFDLFELDETPIILGVKVVLGAYLGRTANHPLMNAGVIVARDVDGKDVEAGFDDIGTHVEVRRYTLTEISAEIVGV